MKTLNLIYLLILLASCRKEANNGGNEETADICFTEVRDYGYDLICYGKPVPILNGVDGSPGKSGSTGSPGSPGQGCKLTGSVLTCGSDAITLPTGGGCSVTQVEGGAKIVCSDGSSSEIKNGESITGPKGDKGDSIAGPKGDKGDSIAGPKGDKGESITGPKGDKGDSIAGPKGDKGDPGTGSSGRMVIRKDECIFEVPSRSGRRTLTYRIYEFSDKYIENFIELVAITPEQAFRFANSAIFAPESDLRNTLPIDVREFQVKLISSNQAYVRDTETQDFWAFSCPQTN